ncbi:MAG: alginate lyase family protein [Planctomycetota bacterium]|jgi:hypothetical protein
MRFFFKVTSFLFIAFFLLFFSPENNAGISCSSISDLKERKHPIVTITDQELTRVKKAWKSGKGDDYNTVARFVRASDSALKKEINFPPRGGQHNNWYHCKKCEIRLKTLAPHKHQCPDCKKVFSGYPYDDVLYSRTHHKNLTIMTNAAWAWIITEDDKYAELAKKILMGYADRYRKYPYHGNTMYNFVYASYSGGHLFEQTLNESVVLCRQIAPSYDLIYNSPVLSKEDRDHIEKNLIVPILKNIDKYKVGKVNWQTWHNAGMLWGGAVIGEPKWIEKAINDKRNGFFYQLDNSLTPDGMWYEMSWGYHYYAMSALVITAEGAERLGVNLWENERLKKAFKLPVSYSMGSNGLLPQLGDSVRPSLGGGKKLFELAYSLYADKDFIPYMPVKRTFTGVMRGVEKSEGVESAGFMKGKVFKSNGHALLRTKGEKKLAAAFTFGPYGGYHGHLDKLSFVLYANGNELAVDPGRAASQAYRLPIHKRWYKPTISHNAVLVNGNSQSPAEGKLLYFKADDNLCAVKASCNTAYSGVKMNRTLLLTDKYLIVLDDIASKGTKDYYWIYHNRASSVSVRLESDSANEKYKFAGAEYFKDIKSYKETKIIKVCFNQKKVKTHLILRGANNLKLSTATGPGRSIKDRVPLCIARQSGQKAYFAALVEPVMGGAESEVKDIAVTQNKSLFVINVIFKDGKEESFRLNDNAVSRVPVR